MTIFEKVASKAFLHGARDSYAAPLAVLRGRVPVESDHYGSVGNNFYEGETIYVCSLRSDRVECESGELESTFRTVTVVREKELPTLAEIETSREVAVTDDNGKTLEELEKRHQKIAITSLLLLVFWASAVFGVFFLMHPAAVLIPLFTGGIIMIWPLIALDQSEKNIHAMKETQSEISNNYPNQLAGRRRNDSYNKIQAGDVWVVQCELGIKMVALLEKHNANNALAGLFTTKLDLLPSTYEMWAWLTILEEIFSMDAQFPVDLIPFHSSRANTVKKELKAQKQRAQATRKKLDTHRKGVLEGFATQDSVQREQLAIEHIKFMED